MAYRLSKNYKVLLLEAGKLHILSIFNYPKAIDEPRMLSLRVFITSAHVRIVIFNII